MYYVIPYSKNSFQNLNESKWDHEKNEYHKPMNRLQPKSVRLRFVIFFVLKMLHTVAFNIITIGGKIMNVFTNEAKKKVVNGTTTENGAYALSTTGSKLLDLYATIGGLRGIDDDRLFQKLEDAIAEDKLLATKLVFYTRDIREGIGERELGRRMFKYLACIHPELIRSNIRLIGEYGRYDDLYSLMFTPLEPTMWEVMRAQLLQDLHDMRNHKPVSLLAKWIKTADASSTTTRELGIKTACRLGYGDSIPAYKRRIRELRKYINVVERKMSANEWDEIDYEAVPSRASLVHRNAFKKHDKERYNDYISKALKGEAKIHTGTITPYDLLHSLYGGDNDTVEAQWRQLPDYVNTDTNILCVVDVSLSMDGIPMEIAISLGLYFAEHNTGDFHNLFVTFSTNPSFEVIRGETLYEKISNMKRADWGRSTDLIKSFRLILEHAVQYNVPAEDMPKSIIVISDMEIDQADDSYRYKTCYEIVEKEYADAGYKIPGIIFWNVCSRNDVFHVDKNRRGVQLASGRSPTIFKSIVESLESTPYEAMLKVLNSERYSAITIDEE